MDPGHPHPQPHRQTHSHSRPRAGLASILGLLGLLGDGTTMWFRVHPLQRPLRLRLPLLVPVLNLFTWHLSFFLCPSFCSRVCFSHFLAAGNLSRSSYMRERFQLDFPLRQTGSIVRLRPYVPKYMPPTCMYWIFLCASRFSALLLAHSIHTCCFSGRGKNYMFWFRNGKTELERWIWVGRDSMETLHRSQTNSPILMTH